MFTIILKGSFMVLLFTISNGLVLFILMQILGVPISNLAVLEVKYDIFSFSNDQTTSGINIGYNFLLANIYILFLYELPISIGHKSTLYLIVVCYLIIRYLFIIIILDRFSLLNAKYELALIVLTLFGTYIVHANIIEKNISMRIPIKEFKNEILLLLILFLYDVLKNGLVRMFENRDTTTRRKKYIRSKYSFFNNKYGALFSNAIKEDPQVEFFDVTSKQKFILLIYSILIYENFSRPKPYRMIENILARFTSKNYSTGLMQVQSNIPLNDESSIILGMSILKQFFLKYYNSESDHWVENVAKEYNPSVSDQYAKEIRFIYRELSQYTGLFE